MSIKANPLSMADPVGRKFFWKKGMFRGIYPGYTDQIKELFDIGLIARLEEENLIPKTTITNHQLDDFELILEQEKIHPVIYPYEWSFNMLKDAALTTIRVNEIVKEFGYETKDSHPSNIMFHGTIPKFVDLGSLQKIKPGQIRWSGETEFVHYFINPLRLAVISDFSITNAILRNDIHLSNFTFAPLLNPINRILGVKFTKKLIVAKEKYKSIGYTDKDGVVAKLSPAIVNILFSLKNSGLLPYIKTNFSLLKRKINKLKTPDIKSQWGTYHDNIDLTPRFKRISEIVKSLNIKTIFEIAANQGFFSKHLLETNDLDWIVATDYDAKAVDKMYLQNKGNPKFNIALMNLMYPATTSISLKLKDRFRADLVIALAVTHHLVLTQGYSIDIVIERASKFSSKYIIIEFMPLGLYSEGYEPPVPEWYNIEWFKTALSANHKILIEEHVEKNRIVFLAEKSKTNE